MSDQIMLSPQRAAEVLACKRGHIYKLIRSGELPATKFGPRMVRIEPEDLERYKASKCLKNGDSANIVESGRPSEERALEDVALSSMKLMRKAQKTLSET